MNDNQLEYMLVDTNINDSRLQDYYISSVRDAHSKYVRLGGKKTWDDFQKIIKKRNVETNELEQINEINNLRTSDVIVIPIESSVNKKERINLPVEKNERGNKFIDGILNGSYLYSRNYGWIDRGHAGFLGGNKPVKKLYEDLLNANVDDIIPFEMSSGGRIPVLNVKVTVNHATTKAKILEKLNSENAKSVALSIFKQTSMAFEEAQIWTDILKKSSFAEEDLPSNILNFYFEVDSENTIDKIENLCGCFTPQQSVWIYKRYSFQRNHSFEPIIKWPRGQKPSLFNAIYPIDEGRYWEKI
jgi:hypothetical protein